MAAGSPRPSALLLSLLFILFRVATSDEVSVLLQFKATVTDPSGALSSWTQNTSPCAGPNKANWQGIICDNNTAVFGLQLESKNLSGQLNLDPLTVVSSIRTLSFADNGFTGPLPDLKKFKGLKNVYLSTNKLSGDIPDDAFDDMHSLKNVVLSKNGFTGRIPGSLVEVETLLELWLDYNGFTGEIPDFEQSGLQVANVSYNKLEGKIPDKLSKMNPSLFAGNKDLCGQPVGVQCPELGSATPPSSYSSSSSSSKRLSPTLIAAIAVVGVGVVLAIIGIAFAVLRHKKQKGTGSASSLQKFTKVESIKTGKGEPGTTTHKKPVVAVPTDEREPGKLVFVRRDRMGEEFELQDLLRASAEVLGSGEFGSSYKALLVNGSAIVVKRFREMHRLSKDDFQGHMRRLGGLNHPNLLPLVAFYYRKEEKLLVTDFIPFGSLASFLHGKRSAENPALDWPARLKIVKGIARGLSYLYTELSDLTAPHGHLKSSNVLLNQNFEPLLADYGLLAVVNHAHATKTMIAFKSPECKQHGRISKKSDVWSLGVLILEILTGKYPGNYSQRGRGGSDLANWVNSVVREEWTGEVFDGEMLRSRNGEGEMLNLLQIGLGCCEADVNKRWELRNALEKIEELKERDADEEFSSFVSDGEVYSSRGMTEDDFSFTTNNP